MTATLTKPELLTLDDLAAICKCSRRHARDVIAKKVGFPELAPVATDRNPLYLRTEVTAFIHRKTIKINNKTRTNPAFASV